MSVLPFFWEQEGGEIAPVSAISPPSPKSEDTFLSGDCQLYFSTGSLALNQAGIETAQGIVNLAIELSNILKYLHENKESCPRLQGFPLPVRNHQPCSVVVFSLLAQLS